MEKTEAFGASDVSQNSQHSQQGNLGESYQKAIYGLPTSGKFILSLQHFIAMFGATVLVPLLTGLDPLVA
ncbi:MAG: hypothetical protein ACK4R7_03110, partial [Fervidobacterium sp.]